MAKNYTFAELVAVINDGKDMEAITDIGRRFPILLNKVTKVTAIAGEAFLDLMSYMPDYLTATKVNSAIKKDANDASATDEDDGVEDPKPMPTATEDEVMPDYGAMNGKTLIEMATKAGIRKTLKSFKKADLVEAMEEYWKSAHSGKATENVEVEATKEADAEVEENEETGNGNPYLGKTAVELFKECKARKIKAESKKPASYYVDLLTAADAEAAKANEKAEDDDDWGDEEVKEEAPAKKKSAKKSPAPAKAEVEDDDDDWDI